MKKAFLLMQMEVLTAKPGKFYLKLLATTGIEQENRKMRRIKTAH